ncbi:MAG: hypothetical protein Q8941_19875 [Bacteroidota bacterium]|nr:hypothetical protein [Bacteroidota bacterium]
MRKIAAILLFLLLLFNWYGYRIVILLMQQKEDRKLESLIDNSRYDESDLIEIRVPLNMPYLQRVTENERLYGQIEIDGKLYTYVRRIVDSGVVVLQCITNTSQQQLLKTINNDWTKANCGLDNDHPGKQQQQSSSFAKNFWSEYDGQTVHKSPGEFPVLNTTVFSSYSFYIPEISLNTPHQPPEC